MLTSEDCMQRLQEKEKMKRKAAQEKQKKKEERERKRAEKVKEKKSKQTGKLHLIHVLKFYMLAPHSMI